MQGFLLVVSIWGSGSCQRIKNRLMRAADRSGGGYGPKLADLRAAVAARGEGSNEEEVVSGDDDVGVAGKLCGEVDHRGLRWVRGPVAGWRSVKSEDRMGVGVSERRVKTAPRYRHTVRRFLDWAEQEQWVVHGQADAD